MTQYYHTFGLGLMRDLDELKKRGFKVSVIYDGSVRLWRLKVIEN